MTSADEKDPAAEKINTYEKIVPEIIPWAIILKKTTRAISLFVRMESERIIGRFVSPSRRNGSGFGMAYSTAERKRQSAEKKVIIFVLFSPCDVFCSKLHTEKDFSIKNDIIELWKNSK